jgi:hypothetical protein
MKFALKCGFAAASLFALSFSAFAEAPGPNHDPSQSIQSSNPTLTAAHTSCAATTPAAATAATGGAISAASMAHGTAPAGAVDNSISNGVDKCTAATGASGMDAKPTPAPAPATKPAQ